MASVSTELTAIEEEWLYPSSDGEPLAETGFHLRALFILFSLLQDWLKKQRKTFLACDMNWYWERGNKKKCRAPDLMVIKGVGRRQRRCYLAWQHDGTPPCFIVEIVSAKTWKEDSVSKVELYARLGVREYFLFDVDARHIPTRLLGYRLDERGRYQAIEADQRGRLFSEELQVLLKADKKILRLLDPQTGRRLLLPEERAERERKRAELQRLRAQRADQQVQEATQQAQEAMQRAERLAQRLRELGIDPED